MTRIDVNPSSDDLEQRLQAIRSGDARILARTITAVENGSPSAIPILKALFPHSGRSRIIGVTGAPGAGKSTLTDALALVFRQRGSRVGIIAVDPTSPFSGGALLGDRIRMHTHSTDPQVFIRSMATRGRLGGLAAATQDVALLLDAAGYDIIIIETVGVGQDEVDIVRVADVALLVLVPGMGDDVQTIKAGLMEIGDILVINKADRPGVEKMEQELNAMLSLGGREDGWVPPIVRTVATENRGIDELTAKLEDYLRHRDANPDTARRRELRAAEQKLLELLRERLLAEALDRGLPERRLEELAAQILDRSSDPYTIVEDIISRILRDTTGGHS